MRWSECSDVTFYHSIFRKSITAFGTLFNNVVVKRKDRSSGETLESLKVPIKYGPAQKYLEIIAAEPEVARQQLQISLPFMSFEIKGVAYDGGRKLAPTSLAQTVPAADSQEADKNVQYSQFLPVPYNLEIELNIITKNQDDGMQVVEQILPNFHPMVNVPIVIIEDTHEERDIAVVLNAVNYVDEYEGDFSDRRFIQWTLSFTVKTYLFGPVDVQKDIRKVQLDYRTDMVHRNTELRYTAEVVSTDEPPVPRDEIDPNTDGWDVQETREDIHVNTGDLDNDFFGID